MISARVWPGALLRGAPVSLDGERALGRDARRWMGAGRCFPVVGGILEPSLPHHAAAGLRAVRARPVAPVGLYEKQV